MADVMGAKKLIQILKARAHAKQCSYGLRRFLEAGHVQLTKKAWLAVCSMPSGPVALGGARTTVSGIC